MTAKELRCRVNDHVGTVLNGPDNIGCSERVVNDERQVVAVGQRCQGINIGHVRVRIAERLGIYQFCVGSYSCLHGTEVVHVDNGIAHSLIGQRVGNQVIGAAIEVVGGNDVVAGQRNVLNGVRHCGCTAGHGQTGHAAFECCHAVFKHALRGVGQTTVDVTGIAQSEAVGSVL